MSFCLLKNFLGSIGLRKISYGYESFSAGNDRSLISLNMINNKFNIKLLPLICYEIIYSGKVNLKLENTNFIINISEDGWFGNSVLVLNQHFSIIAIFRAIEEWQKYIFRSCK